MKTADLAFVFVLAIVSTLAGYVTGQKIGDIHEGISKSEAVAVLGDPDGYQRSGE
jgi:hypothetical protein